MEYDETLDAIENGRTTVEELADEFGHHRAHVNRRLRDWIDEGKMARRKEGRSHVYYKPDDRESATSGEVPGTVPRAERDYDWADHMVRMADVDEYIPCNGEYEEVTAKIDAQDATGQLLHFLLGGPTGCGKTTLAETLAADPDVAGGVCPLFTIQMTYDMSPSALLGKVTAASTNGATEYVWNDAALTKALLASRAADCEDTNFEKVVLLVDEANRARPEVHSTLMSALDHRAEVVLQQRGGETVRGIAENLVVVSTINPPDQGDHYVEDIDVAQKRRLSTAGRYDVNYLGVNFPAREADLVTERTNVSQALADLLVETANQVRDRATEATSDVRQGVPTSAVISWAQSAQALGEANIDNPVVTAADSDVVRALYDKREQEAETVKQIVRDNLDGCPVDGEAVRTWSGDVEWVACTDCPYSAEASEAEEMGVLDFMDCPSCDGHVVYE